MGIIHCLHKRGLPGHGQKFFLSSWLICQPACRKVACNVGRYGGDILNALLNWKVTEVRMGGGEKEEGEGTITDIFHEHNYPVLCKQQRQAAKQNVPTLRGWTLQLGVIGGAVGT